MAPPKPKSDYIEQAPEDDVLYEQLDYLLDHLEEDCPVRAALIVCHACKRAKAVRALLLLPFHTHERV